MENMNKNIAYEHIDFSEITKVRFCTLVEKCNYIPNHWHQSIEFIYLIKGDRLATIENKSFLLHDGDFVLVNANAIHSMKLMETNTIILLQIPIDFLEQFVPDIQEIIFVLNDSKNTPRKQECLNKVKSILLEMKRVYDAKEDGFLLKFNSLLFSLLFELKTHFSVKMMNVNVGQRKKDLARLNIILKYLQENYKQNIALEDIAKLVHFQTNYFCRFFKKHMGVTFIEYQNQVKLAYVYRDLINTKDSLSMILSRHGFNNYKLFRTLFKKHFGNTPMKVRKHIVEQD